VPATRATLAGMSSTTIRPYLVLRPEDHVVLGEARGRRAVALRAQRPARVVRVVHGPGHGLVRNTSRTRPA
jgi:hypothetical protein